MKRSLLFGTRRETALVVAGTGLVAGTYGLVRLAYGLFLPDIEASLAVPPAVVGQVASGASVAYCVAALLGMVAGSHPRRLVLAALLTASLGSLGMALAPTLAVFVPCTVVSSAGAGFASPGLVALVERNVPPQARSRAQATVNAGTGPGLVAAGSLALLLLPQWRLGLLVGAVCTAAAGLAVLRLDRAPTGPAPTGPAATGPGAGRAPSSGRRPSRTWWTALWLPATAAFLLGAASTVVWTYGRTQLVAEGASGPASVGAWIALGVGGTLSVATSRRLSRQQPAAAWLLTASVAAAGTAALGLAAGNLPVALAALTVFGWGFVAATSALIAWAGHLAPDGAATGTALLFVILVLGQAAGSAVVPGAAARSGLSSVFLAAAVTTLAAAACGFRRRPAGRNHDPGGRPEGTVRLSGPGWTGR